MRIRTAAQLVFLAGCVALANLGAADRTDEKVALSFATASHSLPGGEGRNDLTHFPCDPASSDTWQAEFRTRLEDSLARLQTDEGGQPRAALSVTWGSPSGHSNPAPFAKTPGFIEKESQVAMIARLLQEHGLPPGLTSVVAVESAFNPWALSPKGARGLWQLMPETARRYGLNVDSHSDDRINPVKSTRAAAAYMRDLFAQFRDWPLALAAYNAGEDRVARAMTRTGARDFWTLRRHGALPDETLRYVPAVLEKFEGPLDAPESEPPVSPAASGHSESPVGRIAYATPAVQAD